MAKRRKVPALPKAESRKPKAGSSRFFNTRGQCEPERHYMLPPERRVGRALELVREEAYFTLHAGRQTGKTTLARWLVEELNRGRKLAAVWVDMKPADGMSDPAEAFRTVLRQLDHWLGVFLPRLKCPAHAPLLEDPQTAVLRYLEQAARASRRPLVLMLDEVDGLVGPAMVSLLGQLRTGYIARSDEPFPASVVLIGQRRVRDYVLTEEDRRTVKWLGTTSPFNIEAEPLTLRPFTRDEVAELLGQHTEDTGQPFDPEAGNRVFELSQGHPWIVNALAYEAAFVDVKDRSKAITADDVETGRRRIIKERRTNIDSLEARLQEPRVQRVLEPIVLGKVPLGADDTDIEYAVGLGLVRQTPQGVVEIANPIYREVILRHLASKPHRQAATIAPTWLRPDGRLDFQNLLDTFVAFWRRHGEPLMKATPYHEAAPHLVLMAFLHRVENGGQVEREMASGSGRVDLLVRHGKDRLAVEVKVWREEGDPDPLEEGLEQLDLYLSANGLETGWLVVFDRRPGLPRVSERTSASTARSPAGREVTLIRA